MMASAPPSPSRSAVTSLASTCEYSVVDVETANPARRSICQIGLVLMSGTEEISATSWLVDPDGPVTLTWIHGITESRLKGAPRFPHIYDELISLIDGRPVVSHSAFDPQAFRACTAYHGLPDLRGPWIDSMECLPDIPHARRPESLSLPDICAALSIPLAHHDALSDARAAARIAALAIAATGAPIERWRSRSW